MLRVLTLNINYRIDSHGPWSRRRVLIAEAAARAAADVLALQAVEGGSNAHQARELAALLGFDHVAFVAAMQHDGVARGSAILSRYPLAALDVRHLRRRPDHEDRDERLVLKARLHTVRGGMALYNAHFSWIAPQALDNARETVAFRDSGPALLVGDLNAAADSAALAALRAAGWIDLWSALAPGQPGYTFEADRPARRIDYALANAELRTRVRTIERVGPAPDAWPRLSDHLGLLVTLDDSAR